MPSKLSLRSEPRYLFSKVSADWILSFRSPEEKRRSLLRWGAFYLVVAILTAVLIVLAFKKGHAQFDLRGALKKAGGGVSHSRFLSGAYSYTRALQGVSGAAAMVIQVCTLMYVSIDSLLLFKHLIGSDVGRCARS